MLWDPDFKGLKERVKIFQNTEICLLILAVSELRVFTFIVIVSVSWKIPI